MQEQAKIRQEIQTLIKDMGLKDDLKKQLRLKIAERLQHLHQNEYDENSKDQLQHRIIASIIKQYLQKTNCTYSASVYDAESGYQQKFLLRVQLLELLGINLTDKSISILEYIINKSPGRATLLRNVEVQTAEIQGILSLQQKLAVMDLQFRRAFDSRQATSVLKQHKCNEQKQWYDKQLARFKEFQAHKIKIQIGQEWRIKFQAYAQYLEDDYRRRIDRIRNKDRNFTEEAISKQKALEQKIKGWQATAKSRLQLIQMKQNSISRGKINLDQERKRISEQTKKVAEQTKDKGREYDKLLLNVKKRIDYEVGLAKLSMQQAQIQRQEENASRRRFINEEYGKLMGIKDSMQILKKQNQRLSTQNQILREESKRLRDQVRLAYQEGSSKADRIDVLRSELVDLQKNNKDLQMKIIQEQKLKKKREVEVSQTRKQLEKLRSKQLQQSSDQEEIPRRSNTIGLKVTNLREQRRKDIQRLRLQL